MSTAAFTIKVFGVYAGLTGLALLIAPNLLLGLMGVAPATEVWVRVLGAVAAALGYYYLAAAASESRAFFAASIKGRCFFGAACVALVLWAAGPAVLILFAAADVAGALWTAWALRTDARRAAAA